MRLLSLSLALCSFIFAGCADFEPEAGSSVGGKSDELADGDTFTVTIAQAGAFGRFAALDVEAIRYGFTGSKNPGWTAEGDAFIEYDAAGESLPVKVQVPADAEGYLAFAIVGNHLGTRIWRDDQYIPLSSPEGTLAWLPLDGGAPYPFSPECFGIRVMDLNNDWGWSQFDGRVAQVHIGFTEASADQYRNHNDVPWQDVDGNGGHERTIFPIYRHDGGFKGSYTILEERVWVPAGKNLVFKPGIEKFWGDCQRDNDTAFREFTETKTYFLEIQ